MKEDKRGQITIFIILGIIIISIAAFLLWPRLRIHVTRADRPIEYVEECMNNEIGAVFDYIGEQGGDLEPENYIMFQDKKINYLCYTNKYYERCKVQVPLLKQHVEEEAIRYLQPIALDCFSKMEEMLEKAGYNVEIENVSLEVSIIPKKILVDIDAPMRIRRGEDVETFKRFRIEKQSNMYNLLMISTSIMKAEAKLGDSDVVTYMIYYPNTKIQKLKQGDGSTIYIVEDVNTKERFVFASRSVAWPAGYGISEPYVKI